MARLQELSEPVVAIDFSISYHAASPDVARVRECPPVPRMCLSRTREAAIAIAGDINAHLQGFPSSPLPDSNRRPPPYHGGCGPQLCDAEKALGSALPRNPPGFSVSSTISFKDPERP
jgi:hypothetical protein